MRIWTKDDQEAYSDYAWCLILSGYIDSKRQACEGSIRHEIATSTTIPLIALFVPIHPLRYKQQ